MLIRNFFDDFLCMESIRNEIGLSTADKREAKLVLSTKKKQKAKNWVEEKHALKSIVLKVLHTNLFRSDLLTLCLKFIRRIHCTAQQHISLFTVKTCVNFL